MGSFYIDERGNRDDKHTFQSETEACEYIYEEFKKNFTTRTHRAGWKALDLVWVRKSEVFSYAKNNDYLDVRIYVNEIFIFNDKDKNIKAAHKEILESSKMKKKHAKKSWNAKRVSNY